MIEQAEAFSKIETVMIFGELVGRHVIVSSMHRYHWELRKTSQAPRCICNCALTPGATKLGCQTTTKVPIA